MIEVNPGSSRYSKARLTWSGSSPATEAEIDAVVAEALAAWRADAHLMAEFVERAMENRRRRRAWEEKKAAKI